MSAGELAQPNDDAPGGPSPDPAAPENRPVSDSTEALESGLGVDNAAPVGSAAPVETGAPAEPQNSPDVELEALLEDWSFDELAPIPPRFHIHATFASRWKTNDGQGKLIRDEDGLPCLPLEAWLPALHDASLLAAEALDAGRPNGSRWRAWHDYLFGGSGHSGAFAVGRLRIPNRLRERLRVKPGQHDEHAMPRLRALLTTTVASSSGESSEAGVAGAVLSAEAQWTPPADRVRALACTSLLAVAMQLVEQLGDDPRHGFGRVSLSISGFKNTSLAARWLDSHRVPPTRTGRDVLPLPDVSPAADPVLAASEQVAASADAPTSPAAAEAHGHANEGDPDSASDSTDAAFDGSSGENETDAQGEALPEHRRRHRGDHGRDRIHPEEDDAYPTAALIERELWRREIRAAARAWAADPAKRSAFWGSAFPGSVDSRHGGVALRTPPASHWAHLAELAQRIQLEADAKSGASWAEKAKNSPRWKRVWPADALDRVAKVFNDPKYVWELLLDAARRRGGWPTLTSGADKRLMHELWPEAMQAFLTSNADAARLALGEPVAVAGGTST